MIADISTARGVNINIDWHNEVVTIILHYAYGDVTTVYQLWDKKNVTQVRKALKAIRSRTNVVNEV